MRSLEKSNEHFRRAIGKLPLGVSSNFRYWGEDRTIYIRQGKGARIRDFDDNEYIDYRLAYGPIILGYADPRVDSAARAGMDVARLNLSHGDHAWHGRMIRVVRDVEARRGRPIAVLADLAGPKIRTGHFPEGGVGGGGAHPVE